jgi:hypothetical protein
MKNNHLKVNQKEINRIALHYLAPLSGIDGYLILFGLFLSHVHLIIFSIFVLVINIIISILIVIFIIKILNLRRQA